MAMYGENPFIRYLSLESDSLFGFGHEPKLDPDSTPEQRVEQLASDMIERREKQREAHEIREQAAFEADCAEMLVEIREMETVSAFMPQEPDPYEDERPWWF